MFPKWFHSYRFSVKFHMHFAAVAYATCLAHPNVQTVTVVTFSSMCLTWSIQTLVIASMRAYVGFLAPSSSLQRHSLGCARVPIIVPISAAKRHAVSLHVSK
jgi:hypothetical protein